MTRPALAIALLALAGATQAAEPIEWLAENRVRVAAEIDNADSPRDHVKAQLRLMSLAKKACRKKGKPVSEGTLHLDAEGGEEGMWAKHTISEIYVCVAD